MQTQGEDSQVQAEVESAQGQKAETGCLFSARKPGRCKHTELQGYFYRMRSDRGAGSDQVAPGGQ